MTNNANKLTFEAINIFLKFIINKNNNVIFGFTTPPMFILIDTLIKILTASGKGGQGIMLSTNQIFSSLLNETNPPDITRYLQTRIRETISNYEENLLQNGTFIYSVFNIIKNYERIEPTSDLSSQINSIKELITPSSNNPIFDFDNLISISANGDFTFDENYINYITFIKVHLLDLHILKMINNFDYTMYPTSLANGETGLNGGELNESDFITLKTTLINNGITYFQMLYNNPDEIDNIILQLNAPLDYSKIWSHSGMKTNIKYVIEGNETSHFYDILLIHYFQGSVYKNQYIAKFNDLENLSNNLDNIIMNNKLTDLNSMGVMSYDSYQNSPDDIQDKINEIMIFKGSLHISKLANENIRELNDRYYHLQRDDESCDNDSESIRGCWYYENRNPVINSRNIQLTLPDSLNNLHGFELSLNNIIPVISIINLLFGVDENDCTYLSGPRNLLCFNIQVILRHLLQTIKNINIGKLFYGINIITDETIQLIREVRDELVSIFEDFLNLLCNTAFNEDGTIHRRNNKTLNRANCGVCNVGHIYDDNQFFNDNSDDSCNQCDNISYSTCRM